MSPSIAFACAESVLLSSPESTPELFQQPTFAAPVLASRTAGGLKSLADRARERRKSGGVKQQQAGGRNTLAVVVEEEGRGVQDNTSTFKPSSPRVSRPHRRTSLPALQLPPSSLSSRSFLTRGRPPLPMSASLPPSPPDSPSVYNWTLPSPGIVSPLSAHSHLTPSTLARAPWTEIVFPRDLAEANSRAASPPYSDEDDGSEEGACTTPTSITSFGNVHGKDGGYLGLVIPRIEVLPVPQRRAPMPPTVTINGKPTVNTAPRMPFAAAPAAGRRRSSAPSLEQIKAHVASKPTVVRRSTAPSLTFTAPGSNFTTTTTTTTSRLPPFLLARRTQNTQAAKPAVVAPSVVVVPVFTVTPPQERGEGGRKVMALLERRNSGGAPKIVVEPKVWV